MLVVQCLAIFTIYVFILTDFIYLMLGQLSNNARTIQKEWFSVADMITAFFALGALAYILNSQCDSYLAALNGEQSSVSLKNKPSFNVSLSEDDLSDEAEDEWAPKRLSL